jgi:2OG-Fe(II) oxygenase superfamily
MTTDFIEIYDGALDANLCDEIIAHFESCGQKVQGVTGSGVNLAMKDSFDINISRADNWKPLHDRVMESVTEYLFQYIKKYPPLLIGAMATGRRDPTTGESQRFTADDLNDATIAMLMMKLYRPGEIIAQQYRQGVGGYHHWHSEIYPRDASCETLHRVLLFMYYLNTVDEGGETEFLFQQRKIKPEQGRMVIAPAGFTHTHKGHVPFSGDKLILTSWVLFNRAEQIYQ